MKEMDILSAIRFTDSDGIMHLFPPGLEGEKTLLSFRYISTLCEDDNAHLGRLHCYVSERVFFIPDNGVSLWKDLYILRPLHFLLIGNGVLRPEVVESLELLGYSKEDVEDSLSYLYKFVPRIDLDALVILDKGQTYADLYHNKGFMLDGERSYCAAYFMKMCKNACIPLFVSVWSDSLNNEEMRLEDFCGDKEVWKEEMNKGINRITFEGGGLFFDDSELVKMITR